eukprot:gb/GEZN01003788.1/.p1 GENE.gb/GEZN01003788.1/~~gb/GEZN01003788.1/.p1  ORF type:complete len:588 (+),score=28.14 gb/GEZN01003788.1/:169-1932(+)
MRNPLQLDAVKNGGAQLPAWRRSPRTGIIWSWRLFLRACGGSQILLFLVPCLLLVIRQLSQGRFSQRFGDVPRTSPTTLQVTEVYSALSDGGTAVEELLRILAATPKTSKCVYVYPLSTSRYDPGFALLSENCGCATPRECGAAFIPLPLANIWTRAQRNASAELKFQLGALAVMQSVENFITEYQPDWSIPHFVWFYEIPYPLSLVGVDSRLYVLTMQSRLGYEDLDLPSGCWRRCIATPYRTSYMDQPALPATVQNAINSGRQLPAGEWDRELWPGWSARPVLLSFCGTIPTMHGQRGRDRMFILEIEKFAGRLGLAEGVVKLVTGLPTPSNDTTEELEDICLALQAKSKFCIHPPGDSHTRGAFYQSILVGCIPIIFEQSLLSYNRVWHGILGPVSAFSVVLPAAYLHQRSTALQVLLSVMQVAEREDQVVPLLRAGELAAQFMAWDGSSTVLNEMFGLLVRCLFYSNYNARTGRTWMTDTPLDISLHSTLLARLLASDDIRGKVSRGEAGFLLPEDGGPDGAVARFITKVGAKQSIGWVAGLEFQGSLDWGGASRHIWNEWASSVIPVQLPLTTPPEGKEEDA